MVFSRENVFSIIVLILLMGMLGESVASVHKVGGSAGWTILGKVDYNKWTSSDTFTAGDSLLFVYNNQFHNVKQVSRRDFFSCNATSAMATYTSGSDTVALTKPGHFYLFCGFPGNCQAGQKLYVLVGGAIGSPSLSQVSIPVLSLSTGSSSEDSAQNGVVSLLVSTALTSAMSGGVVFLVVLV